MKKEEAPRPIAVKCLACKIFMFRCPKCECGSKPNGGASIFKISTVMPVHNEQDYLRFSLPSLKAVENEISEMIFVLDRCNDKSEALIKGIFPDALIFRKTASTWGNPCAESFQYGFERVSGNIVWALGADLILDPRIPSIIQNLFKTPDIGTLCFKYWNFDLFSWILRVHGFYDNIYRMFIEHLRKEARHSGFYAFRKTMTDEIGGLKDIPSEYDEFARRVKASHWEYVYVDYTKAWHLRTGLTKAKQLNQGKARFYLPQYGLAITVFHSVVHLKPFIFAGFWVERVRNRMQKQQIA